MLDFITLTAAYLIAKSVTCAPNKCPGASCSRS